MRALCGYAISIKVKSTRSMAFQGDSEQEKGVVKREGL